MNTTKKSTFKIQGMHCTSCALNIELDLEETEGIKRVKVSSVKEIAEVEFDPSKIQEDSIINLIKQTGYVAIPLLPH